jgi:hypothetical protein
MKKKSTLLLYFIFKNGLPKSFAPEIPKSTKPYGDCNMLLATKCKSSDLFQ